MRHLYLLLLLCVTTGCASYTAPGKAADLRTLGATPQERAVHGDYSINAQFSRKPLAGFPASIAAIRVQGPNYESHSYRSRSHGGGNFTVLTNREVETEEGSARCRSWRASRR